MDLVAYIDKKLSQGDNYGVKDGYFYYRHCEGKVNRRDYYNIYRYTIVNNQLRDFTKLSGIVGDVVMSGLACGAALLMISLGILGSAFILILPGLFFLLIGGSMPFLQRKAAREAMEAIWEEMEGHLPTID